MLTKRIIPCLDVKDGRTVKGVRFMDLQEAGDIVELAAGYSEAGADELVFLDITASCDKRRTKLSWVEQVAGAINIPFMVGGGISSESDVEALLKKGADKVSVNTSALVDPELISRLSYSFGRQCIVVAIDARQDGKQWQVYCKGGREPTGRELFSWAKEAGERGAGEILFTSMDHDGTNRGFACEATAKISESLNIPVIASGGAGKLGDFYDAFALGKADAALAAGVFHFGKLTIGEVKTYLAARGVEVRKSRQSLR